MVKQGVIPPTSDNIRRAASMLREGELVVFPTETVYGLGGNAENDRAIRQIYALKGRPAFNPLIVHAANFIVAMRYGEFSSDAQRLAQAFWPGPLTLIVPRKKDGGLSHLATAGLDTVGLRVPSHPVAQALLIEADIGVAAPSANRSGRVSPTTTQHVVEELGPGVPLVLEGGACHVGLESTVCDMTSSKPVILRAGAVTSEMLCKKIECGEVTYAADWVDPLAPKSPGMLLKHYAPSIPVRLNAADVKQGEALLAFGPNELQGAAAVENLSRAGDLKEAAANLFAMLRKLDREYTSIAVMPIPEEGVGVAINDRLKRAASAT